MQPPITSVSLFNIVEVNQLELGNKMDKDYFSFYIDHVIPGTKTTHARPVSPKFNTSLSNIEANSSNDLLFKDRKQKCNRV